MMPNPRTAAEVELNCNVLFTETDGASHRRSGTCLKCVDAYARQQVEAEYCKAHGDRWKHQGCKVCFTILHWEKQFEELADEHDRCEGSAKQRIDAALLDHRAMVRAVEDRLLDSLLPHLGPVAHGWTTREPSWCDLCWVVETLAERGKVCPDYEQNKTRL